MDSFFHLSRNILNLDLLLPSFLLSIILLVIHSYFGLEIIKRGIIFTDLSIGQMAATGLAISLYFFDGNYSYWISLFFALIAAFFISLATKFEQVSTEAFIGILYAFGISTVFIIMSKSPYGLEELNRLLAYDILFVNYSQVFKIFILYSILGIVLFLGLKYLDNFLKDLLFFIVFAIAVTSSVSLAGVLVVFSILIAPAFTSLKLFKKNNLFYAIFIGVLVNIFAIIVSYNFDLPTGYTIVFFNTLLPLSISIFLYFYNSFFNK
jgi:zinc/manganese transport system permease protein